MENDINEKKKNLRERMSAQRDGMSPQQRMIRSEKICRQLWNIILEKDVQVLHTYLTMGSEVDVLPLLQRVLDENLTVVAPRTLRKRQMQNLVLTSLENMETGIFGTFHPGSELEYSGPYDLIIVPGLAFDKQGYRVGYGGGYYDTFLAGQPSAWKVGVCYPFQLIEEVPVERHDVRLNEVICGC